MGAVTYPFAKNQEYSLKIGDYWLHSRYNPSQEAEKFIQKVILPTYQDGQILFIVGSGVGYIEKTLLHQYPQITFVSYDFHRYEKTFVPDKNIFDKDLENLKIALSLLITDENYALYQLVIWPATYSIYPLQLKLIEEHFGQMALSANTLEHFSWSWLRNGFRNFLNWEKQLILPKVEYLCLVGSGASVMMAMPYLKQMRDYYFILAVSSSVYSLRSHGIEPDLVITIDGGYYAKEHLQYTHDLPVINALMGAYSPDISMSMLSLGTFFDRWAEQLTLSLPRGRWAGTVTATAIDLALLIADKDVILIGQDFDLYQGYTHLQPHIFYDQYRNNHHRLETLSSHYYQLERHSLATLPHYRQWFRAQKWPSRVKQFFINQDNLGIEQIDVSSFCNKKENASWNMRYQPVLNHLKRKEYLVQLWQSWQENPLDFDLVKFLFSSDVTKILLAQNSGDLDQVKRWKSDLIAKVEDRLLKLQHYLE